MPHISIVSPVYKGERLVDLLVERICEEVSKITDDFEIILVEDGSPDKSWEAIERNCAKDERIKGVKLSRNFGQHYAITAGLDCADAEWIVVMDCDLQDSPDEIPNLYSKALTGYDVVLARRIARKDTFFKRFFSWAFYAVLSYLTGVKHDSAVANFGIYHSKVIRSVCEMRESIRVFPIMVRWVGFKQIKLDVKHSERAEGKSSYNLKRLFDLALDIILSYSDKPIRLAVKTGVFMALFAFLGVILIIFKYFMGQISVLGYASLFVAICFFSGLIMITLGVVGLYVGKTFEGVKKRPVYLVDIKRNLNDD